MTVAAFEIDKFDVELFDRILARGLSSGIGERGGQMCIEAALCETLGLPHGDDPGCVAVSVRSFKIALNDSSWSSTEARAKGLRDLGLAQLGSLGVVDNAAFCDRLAGKIIRRHLPSLLRNAPAGMDFAAAAGRCEKEGSRESAAWAAGAARAAWAAEAAEAAGAARAAWAARAAEAARAARAAGAAEAAWAAGAARAAWAAGAAEAARAAWAAGAAEAALPETRHPDFYLLLAADLALETLKELNSPGCALLKDAA